MLKFRVSGAPVGAWCRTRGSRGWLPGSGHHYWRNCALVGALICSKRLALYGTAGSTKADVLG